MRLSLTLAEQVGYPSGIADAHQYLGVIAMCQHRWDEAISHYQKCFEVDQAIGNPQWIGMSHRYLGLAYLKQGDYHQAIQAFEGGVDRAIEARHVGQLANSLCGLEKTIARRQRPGGGGGRKRESRKQKGGKQKPKLEDLTFVEFCRSFKERHADALKTLSLRQWYLEPVEPSKEFSYLSFADDFETETLDPLWQWADEFGDCVYRIVEADGVRPNGLEICAANGRGLGDERGLNFSAPRLMREINKDFAVKVCVSPSSEDKPRMGGILVWKNKDNFLRLEIGVHDPAEVRLHGYISGKLQVAGRGLLLGNGEQGTGDSIEKTLEKVHLRLERIGKEFAAYCSVDGKEWYTAGVVEFPVEDPIEVGLHAIGNIDRAIYNGAYPEGTATLFQSFKLWTQ